MVLQIRLSNFFSINEEVILDMQAASLQTKESKDLLGNTFVCNDEREPMLQERVTLSKR